jgi:CRISPR-associated protein Csm5
MNEILIETLTPVHVGSGRVLLGGTEHVPFKGEGLVAVLDDRKVLSVIGAENVNKWVSAITTGGSIQELLLAMKKGLKPEDVAERTVKASAMPAQANSMREQIHNVFQKPYIPGSSLKGSLRTAWFSTEVRKKGNLQRSDLGTGNGEKFEFNDMPLQKELLSNNSNSHTNTDLFRLLRVDDYLFDETECLLAETLNSSGRNWSMKEPVAQYIECIPQGAFSRGRLQEAGDLKKIIKSKGRSEMQLPGMDGFSIRTLLKRANTQTHQILIKEIKLWEAREEKLPTGAFSFVEELKRLEKIADACSKSVDCAVIRLGFGSGHESMSGGWQDSSISAELQKEVANKIRGKKYEGFEFPKTRKMVNGGTPLGFICIRLLPDAEIAQILTEKKAVFLAKQEEKRQESLKIAQEEEVRRQEASRPKSFTGKLKTGIELEGEIISLKDNTGYVRLVINEAIFEVPLRGLSNPDLGAVVRVKVAQLPGNQLREVNFAGFKKI